MSTDGGYIRLYRSLLDHHAFRNQAEAMAFACMVLRAAWRPTTVRYKGRQIQIQRGQLCLSIRDFANDMDRDKSWVERMFQRLKRETMIETKVETLFQIITICNYNEYQLSQDGVETLSETVSETPARQSRDSRETQNKEEKQGNTSEAKASSEKTARSKSHPFPCPDGVDPQHWKDFLAARKRKGAVQTETAYLGVLRSLAEYATDEWPPGRLVQRSAEKGWGKIVNPNEQDNRNGTGNNYANGHTSGSAGQSRTAVAARRSMDRVARFWPDPSDADGGCEGGFGGYGNEADNRQSQTVLRPDDPMPGPLRRVGDGAR